MTAIRRPAFELPRMQLLPLPELPDLQPRPPAAMPPVESTIVAPPIAQLAPPALIATVAPVARVDAVPLAAAPVISRRAVHRRDGALGLTIGIVLLTLVLAAALTAQRTMHGWPPGMH